MMIRLHNCRNENKCPRFPRKCGPFKLFSVILLPSSAVRLACHVNRFCFPVHCLPSLTFLSFSSPQATISECVYPRITSFKSALPLQVAMLAGPAKFAAPEKIPMIINNHASTASPLASHAPTTTNPRKEAPLICASFAIRRR